MNQRIYHENRTHGIEQRQSGTGAGFRCNELEIRRKTRKVKLKRQERLVIKTSEGWIHQTMHSL